jgi:copper chaperone CopZ
VYNRQHYKYAVARQHSVVRAYTLQGGRRMMKTELNINGMHCESCALDIKETLDETAGVLNADVSFNDSQAIVEFDEQIVQQTTLVKKIQDLGYQATIAAATQGGA